MNGENNDTLADAGTGENADVDQGTPSNNEVECSPNKSCEHGLTHEDILLLRRMEELGIPANKRRIDNHYGFSNNYLSVKELQGFVGGYAIWTCVCKSCSSEFSIRSMNIKMQTSCSTGCSKFNQSVRTHLNKKYGCVTIVALNPVQDKAKGRLCTVKCDCGQTHEKSMGNVVRPNKPLETCSKTCGLKKTNNIYVGTKLHRLQIAKIIPASQKLRSSEKFLCVCECGNVTTPESKSVLKGTTTSCGCYHKSVLSAKTGALNPNWRDGATTEAQADRTSREKWEWVKQVHVKYDYTCQCCGYKNARASKLHAHHIENFKGNVGGRFDINNGITLCKDCHNDFHGKFGRVDNNMDQLQDYIQKYKPESPRENNSQEEFLLSGTTDISIDYVISDEKLISATIHRQGKDRRRCGRITETFSLGDTVWFTDNISHGILYKLSFIDGSEAAFVRRSFVSDDGKVLTFELDRELSLDSQEFLEKEGALFSGMTCSFEINLVTFISVRL